MALTAEAEAAQGRIETLGRRLVDLAAEREDLAAQFAIARAVADVDQVHALTSRLAAVDDVAADVQARAAVAVRRRHAWLPLPGLPGPLAWSGPYSPS